MVSDEIFALVKAVGSSGGHLWYSQIVDMDRYTAELEILVDNVLDAFGAIDLSKLIWKSKLHLLVHAANETRCFGPLVKKSTEIQEKFNGCFRNLSMMSNGHALSRDIAVGFAMCRSIAHVLLGGFLQ